MLSNKIVFALLSSILLTACHPYVDESAINTEEGMDPGVRQVVMQEEHEEPQQEEGIIPAPSEQMYSDGFFY
jgi:hypothetical protein